MARLLQWPTYGATIIAPPITVGRAKPVQASLRLAEGQAIRPSRFEDIVLFLIVAITGSILGVWAVAGLHLYHIDNVARTYSAVQVFFGYEPKLANIGFIWPPIPALLRLPLVALFPSLAFQGGTGAIVSAICGGLCLVLLNRILALHVPGRSVRYSLLALYQTNPLVFYLTISGLSEVVFLMFALLAWLSFQRIVFEEPMPLGQVGVMGVAAAGAVLSRYEGITYVLVLGGLLTTIMYLHKRPRQWSTAEGLGITYVAPWGYALAVWLFFNSLIMGDMFYFMAGKASLSEFQQTFLERYPVLQDLVGNPVPAARFALRISWDASPAFVLGTVLAAIPALFRRDLFLVAMLVAGANFPAFQAVLSLLGQSSGWLRYHVYEILFGVLLFAYFLRQGVFPALGHKRRLVVASAMLLFLGWSNVVTWKGLDDPGIVPVGESSYLRSLITGTPSTPEYNPLSVASYFRESLFPVDPDALVLTDEQHSNDIVLFSGKPRRFVTPHSLRFTEYLDDPVGKVNFILVPETVQSGVNLVLEAYPKMYEDGVPFATLEYEFTGPLARGWRLYRVHPDEDGTLRFGQSEIDN